MSQSADYSQRQTEQGEGKERGGGEELDGEGEEEGKGETEEGVTGSKHVDFPVFSACTSESESNYIYICSPLMVSSR